MNKLGIFGLCLFMVITIFLCDACQKTTINPEVEKAQIEKIIKYSIDWALTKDFKGLYDCFVQDSTFFVFHPDSRSTRKGFESFRKNAENVFMDDRFKAVSSNFKDIRINLSQDGNVAWYSLLLDDYGTWEGQPFSWENCRWTGVLEKKDNRWVICQMHFSLAEDQIRAESSN